MNCVNARWLLALPQSRNDLNKNPADPSKPYTRRSSTSRCESQFPTATFALKSFFGLLLGSCASAAWTLHRAHLCQRAVRSYFEDMERGLHGGLLQSTSHRHPSDTIRFMSISGSTALMEKLAQQNQSVEVPERYNECRSNVTISGNFFQRHCHLSYQDQNTRENWLAGLLRA